jgi:hypothetical protein
MARPSATRFGYRHVDEPPLAPRVTSDHVVLLFDELDYVPGPHG